MTRRAWILAIAISGAGAVIAGASAFAAAHSGPGAGSAVAGSASVPSIVRTLPATSSSVAGTTTLYAPATVMRSDNGDTVVLPVGQSVVLDLGAPGNWRVTVTDPSVLEAQSGPQGTQGTFLGKEAGSTSLRAVTVYPCETSIPRCMIADAYFHISITVTPTAVTAPQVLVQGDITRLVVSGVVIRTPPVTPVCASNAMCPLFIAQGRGIFVDLGGATFTTSAGQTTPRPGLRVGEWLVAAGSFDQETLPAAVPTGFERLRAVTASLESDTSAVS